MTFRLKTSWRCLGKELVANGSHRNAHGRLLSVKHAHELRMHHKKPPVFSRRLFILFQLLMLRVPETVAIKVRTKVEIAKCAGVTGCRYWHPALLI